MLFRSSSWYKTTCLDFWNYIKGKISSVLGLTKDNYGGKARTAGTADSATTAGNADTAYSLSYGHSNEINFKGGAPGMCYFNFRNADTESHSPVDNMRYMFCNYGGDASKSEIQAGSFYGTTVKASGKMIIPIGAPSSLENGCIWIER